MTSLRRIGILLLLLPLTAATACTATTRAAGPTHHPIAETAKRWQLVRYHGVQVRVPAAWPVVNGLHAAACIVFGSGPTVYLGPSYGSPTCPPGDQKRGTPGVWLQPGTAPPDTRLVKSAAGVTVAEERTPAAGNLEPFWSHRVQILIGVGPGPRLAKAIIASLRYLPGAPDTKAAGNCPRVVDTGSMPTPRRLNRRLVVDEGNTTLAPPPTSARPVMPAARAWKDAGQKVPFDRYQIFLTLYSSKYPGDASANGPATPLDHDVLAWVIYATPATSAVPICGGWQLDAYNALTSQGIILSSYGPGP